jgi:hypothetical protein
MFLSILCQIQNQNWIGGFKTSFNYDIFIRPNDLIITPIYFVIIIFLAALYSNQSYHNQPIRKYFLPGLIVKLVGAICVGLVYQFYYKGAGDTAVYYGDGKLIGDLLSTDKSLFLNVLSAKGGVTDPDNILQRVGFIQFFHDPSAFLIDKIVACIGLFTFQTYTTIALVLATISFFGAWALYITFCKIYPNLYKQFAIAILFIPSVVFWGSGILKDCVTFGCLGWFTYAAYNIFFLRRKIISSALLFMISGLLILQIKSYIILSFVPSLLFWFFLTYRSRIKSTFSRNLLTPVIVILMASGGYLIAQKLGQESAGYSINNFVKTASVFQAWHGYLAETTGASGYNLGTIDPTALGALEKFPAAINVTLFRPYLWEAHNPVVFLAAVESFIITIFTLRIFIRTGIVRTVKIIFQTPVVTFCIFFSMLFAFAVGFTAYNFGALVRYKIPCIPFYVSALFILNYVTQEEKARSKRFSKTVMIKANPLTVE